MCGHLSQVVSVDLIGCVRHYSVSKNIPENREQEPNTAQLLFGTKVTGAKTNFP